MAMGERPFGVLWHIFYYFIRSILINYKVEGIVYKNGTIIKKFMVIYS